MWDEQLEFSHYPFDCDLAGKKHKCMGNVPTFSAVLFFEVEVATDNRHFHSERIEIAKQGKNTKNAQDAGESKKHRLLS